MALVIFSRLARVLALVAFVAPALSHADGLSPGAGPAYAWEPLISEASDGVLRLQLQTSEPLAHRVFTLENPPRVVVDFPEIAWRIPAEEAKTLHRDGVLNARFGLYRIGTSRLVLDLDGPAQVVGSASLPAAGPAPARFVLEFQISHDGKPFSLPQGGDPQTRKKPALAKAVLPLTNPRVIANKNGPGQAPRPSSRPRAMVIAIDPGHGGVDPGASYGGVSEKVLTLTFANELKEVLTDTGRFRVVLTRTKDEFVPLAERVERARDMGADLFLSIHADALPSRPDVSGASVYTLAKNASDELAGELARRENASDAIAGVEMPTRKDNVRRALVDLAKRRTKIESEGVASLLIDELSQRVPVLPKRPHRKAGFRVLKTFDTPSALIELGFLTNLRDRRRLTNPGWREQAALSIAAAVRRWSTQPAMVAGLRR
ncbi:MAG: N-acetylmuramoyl-L-alanine amidase [Rhodobacteraceae bacterium]|nr:N-acetylmuramoyl-L-alanine amidase [Paracoccaceae bacterium]